MYTGSEDGSSSFSPELNLEEHQVSQANTAGADRLYHCEHPGCGFRTKYKRGFMVHTAKHTGKKNYKCPASDCEYATNDGSLLIKHRRKLHGYQTRQKARSTPSRKYSARKAEKSSGSVDASAAPSTPISPEDITGCVHAAQWASEARTTTGSSCTTADISTGYPDVDILNDTIWDGFDAWAQAARRSGYFAPPLCAVASSFTSISPEGVTEYAHTTQWTSDSSSYFNYSNVVPNIAGTAPGSSLVPTGMHAEFPVASNSSDKIWNHELDMSWAQTAQNALASSSTPISRQLSSGDVTLPGIVPYFNYEDAPSIAGAVPGSSHTPAGMYPGSALVSSPNNTISNGHNYVNWVQTAPAGAGQESIRAPLQLEDFGLNAAGTDSNVGSTDNMLLMPKDHDRAQGQVHGPGIGFVDTTDTTSSLFSDTGSEDDFILRYFGSR